MQQAGQADSSWQGGPVDTERVGRAPPPPGLRPACPAPHILPLTRHTLTLLIILPSHQTHPTSLACMHTPGVPVAPGALPLIGHTLPVLANIHRIHDWLVEQTEAVGGATWAFSLPAMPTYFVATSVPNVEYVLKVGPGGGGSGCIPRELACLITGPGGALQGKGTARPQRPRCRQRPPSLRRPACPAFKRVLKAWKAEAYQKQEQGALRGVWGAATQQCAGRTRVATLQSHGGNPFPRARSPRALIPPSSSAADAL